MELNQIRRFSLEGDFMDYKTNDLLYGFLRCLSTAYPTGKKTENNKKQYEEYLSVKQFKKQKKLIAQICGCSTRTIDNQLKKLEEVGLIELGTMEYCKDNNSFEYEVFYFPFDYDGNYQLAETRVINYLMNTRSAQAIRIYIYLLNKYEWKKTTGENYIFTLRELKQALGYSTKTKTADTLIKDILISFKTEGIIQYRKIKQQQEIGNESELKYITVERMELLSVVNSANQLPKY